MARKHETLQRSSKIFSSCFIYLSSNQNSHVIEIAHCVQSFVCHHHHHFFLLPLLPCFVFPVEVSRGCWGYSYTAITPQDDYGAANGADLMDGTSEDVQPPCSLAIKSPLPCLHHIIHIQSYISSSSRGVMTIRQQPMKSKTLYTYHAFAVISESKIEHYVILTRKVNKCALIFNFHKRNNTRINFSK